MQDIIVSTVRNFSSINQQAGIGFAFERFFGIIITFLHIDEVTPSVKNLDVVNRKLFNIFDVEVIMPQTIVVGRNIGLNHNKRVAPKWRTSKKQRLQKALSKHIFG